MNITKNLEIEKKLKALKIVPVVNLPSIEAGIQLGKILMKHEMPVAEVTFRTPVAASAIAAMKNEFPNLLLLAGTVLSIEQVDIAVKGGAECIVIPGYHQTVVDYCINKEIMVCPGVTTPTEAITCMEKGINTVKFFPAAISGGIPMLKALSAVFNSLHFMPTGGIKPSNLKDYLALNSVICCGGSWLAPEDLMASGQWDEIESRIEDAKKMLS